MTSIKLTGAKTAPLQKSNPAFISFFQTFHRQIKQKIIFDKYIENFVGTGLAPVRYNVCCENNIKLTDLGNIIEKQWIDIPNEYNNVDLDK